MACTITDLTVNSILEYGIFASYTEYHAFEMGLLLPVVCVFIAYFDERVAALTLTLAVLGGLGIIPVYTVAPVVMEKPWYFISGLVVSSAILISAIEMVKTDRVQVFSTVKQIFVR